MSLFWLFFASNCAIPQNIYSVSKISPTQIKIYGKIDDRVVEEVGALITPQVKEVLINSGGGYVAASIKIARLIKDKSISIIVAGLCASSCAQYIFPAGTNNRIENDSLLIFHNYISSLVDIARARGLNVSDVQTELSRQEKKLYADLGVDADVFMRSQLELRTVCLVGPQEKNSYLLFYKSVFSGWVPPQSYLKDIGYKFSGFWPATASDVDRIIRSLTADNRPRLYFGGDSKKLTENVTLGAQNNISICGE